MQGKLVNETRCLRCETVTSREEAFYDLSLEIEQNSSLTACLKNFRLATQLMHQYSLLKQGCIGVPTSALSYLSNSLARHIYSTLA